MDNLTSELLGFSVTGVNGVDALREAMTPYLDNSTFEFEPGVTDMTARISIRRLAKIQIYSGRYQDAFCLRIPNWPSFVQVFPTQGSGKWVNNGVSMQISSGRGAVGEPGDLKVSLGANFSNVCVFIEPNALFQALAGLLGAPPGRELKLDRSNPERRSPAPLSFWLLRALAAEIAPEDAAPSPLLIAELEQAFLVAFLCSTAHNYSHLLQAAPCGLAPREVRRVEEYIEANWNQPITIGTLALAAKASARSIFCSFKMHRGCSPMNFVKQVRLRHAREMLGRPDSEVNVTNAAMACAFGNAGHFARDYKQAFGEMPSETLRRAKVQPPSRTPRGSLLSNCGDCSLPASHSTDLS